MQADFACVNAQIYNWQLYSYENSSSSEKLLVQIKGLK